MRHDLIGKHYNNGHRLLKHWQRTSNKALSTAQWSLFTVLLLEPLPHSNMICMSTAESTPVINIQFMMNQGNMYNYHSWKDYMTVS